VKIPVSGGDPHIWSSEMVEWWIDEVILHSVRISYVSS
jgi:hypothetical protein